MPGGDSIEERGISMPKGLDDSDAIVKECHEELRHLGNLGNRGITVEGGGLKGGPWLCGVTA